MAIPLASAVFPQEITHHVRVFDFGFEDSQSGEPLTVVHAGTTVVWDFFVTSTNSHTAQSEYGASPGGLNTPTFNSGTMPPGAHLTFAYTFTTPGVVEYRCAYHYPRMTGVVVVTP